MTNRTILICKHSSLLGAVVSSVAMTVTGLLGTGLKLPTIFGFDSIFYISLYICISLEKEEK